MKFIGQKILEVIGLIKKYRLPEDKTKRKEYLVNFQKEIEKSIALKKIRQAVKKLAIRFPIP
jgi:hypothetical protein